MTETDLSRRGFLRGEFFTSLQSQTVKQQRFNGIRPPWAVENTVFTEGCTRCGDCISVCETGIIVKGDGSFPEIRFAEGECTFCRKCVDICRQPVFRVAEELPWSHKIEITDSCLSRNQTECRICEDSCEMRAIRFKPMLGKTAQINLNPDSCNGCGACIRACPINAIKLSYQQNSAV